MIRKFVLGIALALVTATGISYARPPAHSIDSRFHRLAREWVQLYLRRNPTQYEVLLIANQLRAGYSPLKVQANIMATDEYFRNAGNNNFKFIQRMVADVLGRLPTLTEQSHLLGTIFTKGRNGAALETLVSRQLAASSPWWYGLAIP